MDFVNDLNKLYCESINLNTTNTTTTSAVSSAPSQQNEVKATRPTRQLVLSYINSKRTAEYTAHYLIHNLYSVCKDKETVAEVLSAMRKIFRSDV